MMNRRGQGSFCGNSYDPVATVFILFDIACEVRESNSRRLWHNFGQNKRPSLQCCSPAWPPASAARVERFGDCHGDFKSVSGFVV